MARSSGGGSGARRLKDLRDLADVAVLSRDPKHRALVAEAEGRLSARGPAPGEPAAPPDRAAAYARIVQCSEAAVAVDAEIAALHAFVRGVYGTKFPELETLVAHPVDYSRVVARIGNEMDLTEVDLSGLLPSATIMVVTVTASTTSGAPLAPAELEQALGGCQAVLELDREKGLFLDLVQRELHQVAPNLTATVGSEVAAELIGLAGGLKQLSQMPACNVQVLGSKKKNLAGFSSANSDPHQGVIWKSEVVQKAPPALRAKAARLVGAKCTMMARVDSYGQDPSGVKGQAMKGDMMSKVEKWQELPPARIAKPLPVPDMERKKRRGGRRYRKTKERYGQTDVRQAQNRVAFNQAEEEVIDGDETLGLGMLGSGGSGAGGLGKLRMEVKQQRQKISKQAQKRLGVQQLRASKGRAGSSGLASSLVFTPVQGIELHNPLARGASGQARGGDTASGNQSYFSSGSGFSRVAKAKDP